MANYWDGKEWVTNIKGDWQPTEEGAKQNLINKLLELNGVTLTENNEIQVLTKNKVYCYPINAWQKSGKQIGVETRESMFVKGKIEYPIYEQGYVACLGKSTCCAKRRKSDNYER